VAGERGAVTLWGIGIVLVLFGVAGLALDTWRVFAERQALAGLADSASIAAATAIDVDLFRATGVVALDQDQALHRALAYVAAQAPDLDDDIVPVVTFPGNGVEVSLERDVELTIVGVFLDDDAVHMSVAAYATPGERTNP
jgi:hypothetical protein